MHDAAAHCIAAHELLLGEMQLYRSLHLHRLQSSPTAEPTRGSIWLPVQAQDFIMQLLQQLPLAFAMVPEPKART